MARPTAAGELSTGLSRSFVPGWAREQDAAELREVLRQTPMPGKIRVSLEFSDLSKAMPGWERHYTAVAREPGIGRVFAMCSRSVRDAFVNGGPVSLGYLSQLRILPGHRAHKRGLLKMGFEWLEGTRAPTDTTFDITTLVEGNRPAHRLLTAGLRGLPVYSPLGRMLTFLIPVSGGGKGGKDLPVERGTPDLSSRILACLERFGARHQFAPRWTAAEVRTGGSSRAGGMETGVPFTEFFVVSSGERVRGCLAVWDQRQFKQVVVRGYAPLLARLRPLLNVFGAGLPQTGSVLAMAWLSHLAIDDDQPQTFVALVNAVRAHLRGKSHIRWLALMLAEAHPLTQAAKRLASHTYASELFAVHDPASKPDLDSRVPHLEGALL